MGSIIAIGTRKGNSKKGNCLAFHFREAMQLLMLKLYQATKVQWDYSHTKSELNLRGSRVEFMWNDPIGPP